MRGSGRVKNDLNLEMVDSYFCPFLFLLRTLELNGMGNGNGIGNACFLLSAVSLS